jgi:hypothetical protein
MRFIFKTSYEQDLRLAKHSGHVFWYSALALFLVAAPWVALIGVGILYAGMLPFSMMSYARVKKSQRTVSEAT